MVGEKIKQLRIKEELTQKELADKLFVTPQAVSRWEKGEVEPSVSTLSQLAVIFGVSVDELLGGQAPVKKEPEKQEPEKVIVQKEVVYQQAKPVLGVCEACNKPIYASNQIVREPHYQMGVSKQYKLICYPCHVKFKRLEDATILENAEKWRTRSFIWATVAAVAVLLAVVFLAVKLLGWNWLTIGSAVALPLLVYPFVGCLLLRNNFIDDIIETIGSWGFVRFPGLIFELSLDGIVWLLTVKLAFWIIGFALAAAFIGLACIVGMLISPVVYPFALIKSYAHPEETDTL